MPVAYWCVALAAGLPYLWVMLAKSQPDYDNRAPREFLGRSEGWRQRANWAQLNAWEAFAPFAAAAIIAVTRGAPESVVTALSVAFIAFRVGHGIAYIANKHAVRSILWSLGFLCVIGLFIAASRAG